MRKLFTPILFVIAVVALLPAQQAPQYSLYLLNPYAYNPAYAGMDNSLVATGVYRQQWSNLKGAPETQHLNMHLPLYIISSGVGMRVENDIIGAHRSTQAILTYSFHRELGQNAVLSVGVSGGYLQYALDGAKLRAPDGIYEPSGVFQHDDPFLPEGKVVAGTPVVEAGVYLQLNEFSFGVATQPVFAPVLEASDNGTFRLQPVRHYVGAASYQFSVGQNLAVKPGILVKSDLKETQAEISSIIRWKENIFAGASFRGFSSSARDAMVLLGGLRLNERTTLAYSFDIPLSALQASNRGSHELLLRYELNKPVGAGKLPPVIYNPRFF